MLKAIIMDFDGVIVDTEVAWYDIFQEWFQKNYQYDLSVEDFLICVGSDSTALFAKLEKILGVNIDKKSFSEETVGEFVRKTCNLPPKLGVEQFIYSVKQAGLKLALATSSKDPKARAHLTRLDLIRYFDVIVTADIVEKIKPEPDLFLKALELLNVDSTEALIIEDSLNGLIAGQNANINVLLVPNDVTKYSNFDNYFDIVKSLEEVNINTLKARYQ